MTLFWRGVAVAACVAVLFPVGDHLGAAAPASPPGPTPAPSPTPSPAFSPPAATVIPVSITLAQEVPPPGPETPRTATGTGAVVVNAGGSEIGFAFTYSALSGQLVAAHFHRARSGEAGPIVQTICGEPAPALFGPCPAGNSGTIAGLWKIPLQIAVDLQAGRLYVNFHTRLNPGGEIRGQILPPR